MRLLWLILVLIGVIILGEVVYLSSGYYDISAVHPHRKVTLAILNEVRERSIAFHSKDIKAPPAVDESMLLEVGQRRFQESCRLCHGAPGLQREGFADGLYPNPPYLGSKDIQSMNDKEIFWVIKNGIKMTGMPAFGIRYKDEELWGVVKIVRSLSSSSAPASKTQGQESKQLTVIQMTNEFKYVPNRVKIKRGDTIEWRNVSQVVHTVTADPVRAANPNNVVLPKTAKAFDSGDIQPGRSFTYTFSVPGEYRYFCVPHETFGMVGEIEVAE